MRLLAGNHHACFLVGVIFFLTTNAPETLSKFVASNRESNHDSRFTNSRCCAKSRVTVTKRVCLENLTTPNLELTNPRLTTRDSCLEFTLSHLS